MRSIIFLLLLSLPASTVEAQAIPGNYLAIDSARGDLDKDGIDELAIIYNMRAEDSSIYADNVPRELMVYKNSHSKWTPWRTSKQAVLGKAEGGMWGDPLEGIEIKKGILIISHFGGAGWKWRQIDKYRFQNGDFFLVGYSSMYGRPCQEWQDVDYNLSTGKIVVEKEYENCEDSTVVSKKEKEAFFRKGTSITLEKRREKDIIIRSPKYKHEFYISTKQEDE